ncbi:MAG: hypothetical protein V5A64_07175 [Candidatus Thermoplasmatota archaeon]
MSIWYTKPKGLYTYDGIPYIEAKKMNKENQIKRIIRMRDALVNNDVEEQKQIVREHLANMWVKQLSTDINNIYKED